MQESGLDVCERRKMYVFCAAKLSSSLHIIPEPVLYIWKPFVEASAAHSECVPACLCQPLSRHNLPFTHTLRRNV